MMMELSEVLAKKYLERQEARVKLDAAEVQNVSLREPEALPDETKPLTYFGMSLNSCIEQLVAGEGFEPSTFGL